jgi:CHAT domain-containing protein
LRCNVYLGNYHKLISNLDHLTEVIQLLSAEESAGRLFRERTASIRQNAIDAKRRFQMFVSGLESIKHLLENESERGVIGIYSNCESGAENIVIDRVTKDSPAEAAGILAGDILVRVGEAKVQNISQREYYDLLTGEPNTFVNIIIKRKDEEITFNLPRKSRKIYPVHRQIEFTNLIERLQKYHVALSDLVEMKLACIEELNLDIVRGNIDFIEAWTILRNNLVVLGEEINSKIKELLELKETLFIEYPDFLEDINSAINITIHLRENIINRNNFENSNIGEYTPHIIEVDSRIETFLTNNPQLSQIETILFRCYLHSFQAINDFYASIHLEQNFMSRIDIVRHYEENQKSSQILLHSLTQYIERWRGKLVEDLEKIDALQQAQPLFAKVLEMSVALGDAKEALIFSEKSRARAFADLLATRFEDDTDRELVDTPVTSPEINFEQIKQIAQTHSATVVEYFVVKKEESEVKIYIWVIQPNGNTVLETVELNSSLQPPSGFLSNLITRARASFGVKDSETFSNSLKSSFSNIRDSLDIDLSTELENSQTLLAELYQLLIEPIEYYLESSLTSKVILIPHEKLFELPLATLLNPKTNQYLIEQYSIILSPSIQTLDLTQQNFASKSDAQNVLVVGNPKMPSLGESPEPLAKLPYAEMAAKAISNIFKTKPLLGNQATKTEVLTQLPSAKIIHFGTHGKFNRTQPLKGGIALAPEGKEWGFLTVEEILAKFAPPQTSSLNTELVVLSACSTGLGQITGDGVIGLARGLMAAGVKAVLVSLWEVKDFPTACLMVQFYKYLQSGNTPSDALKQAQVWLKNVTNEQLITWMRQGKLPLKSMEKEKAIDWLQQHEKQGNLRPFQHPYYWGAFYLIGA